MVKVIYFEGGEDIQRRTLQQINYEAFIDAGGTPTVLIFPWTTENDEKRKRHIKIMEGYFKEVGAREVLVVMPNESDEKILRKVLSSNLIYFPGGSPNVFMKYCENKDLKKQLSMFEGVIIGNSAGSMVLGKEFVIIEDKNNSPIEIVEGLGLVDFSIEPHYNPKKDEKLKQLSIGRKIYALPENSAMKLNEGTNIFKFFGDVYIFSNGVKKKLN